MMGLLNPDVSVKEGFGLLRDILAELVRIRRLLQLQAIRENVEPSRSSRPFGFPTIEQYRKELRELVKDRS